MAEPNGRESFFRTTVFRCFGLGLIGALVNWLAVPPIPMLPLYLAGVVYLFVLLRFGMAWGLLTAAIAALPFGTKLIVALPLMEVAGIGFLIQYRKWRPLKAGLVFWAVLGIPYATFMAWQELSPSSLDFWLMVLLLASCGLLNLYLARIITGLFAPSGSRDLPLRTRLTLWLTVFAVMPVLTGTGLLGRFLVESRVAQINTQLTRGGDNIQDRLARYLETRMRLLALIARQITVEPSMNAARVHEIFADLHRDSWWFMSLLWADDQGRILTGAPDFRADGTAIRFNALTVADRDYFTNVRTTRKPYVSGVFQGRGFGNEAIVALSVPIFRDQQFLGIIEGSLALSNLAVLNHEASASGEKIRLLLLDSQQRVIYADRRLALPFLTKIPDELATVASLAGPTSSESLLRDVRPYLYQLNLVRRIPVTNPAWQIVLLYDLKEEIRVLNLISLSAVLASWLVVLLARGLAKRQAQDVLKPLLALSRRVESMDFIDLPTLMPLVQTSGSRELVQLVKAFNAMIARLSKSHLELLLTIEDRDRLNQELEDSNQALERKVADRTEELRQKARVLEQLSVTDSLTGVNNRRYLMNELEKEWRRSHRLGQVFSVLILDIDHFKAINDRYGHLGGDAVLRAVARILRDSVRETDTVARFGGEEFVVLLPGVALEQARQFAERVRRRFAEQAVLFEQHHIVYTVSFGLVDSRLPGVSSEETLLMAADQALYSAKSQGRNRVCSLPEASCAP